MGNEQFKKIVIKLDNKYILHDYRLSKFILKEFSTDKNCPLIFPNLEIAKNILKILQPRLKNYKLSIDTI